jgi:pimeloyl-ACP methyl ester carboxylesterase
MINIISNPIVETSLEWRIEQFANDTAALLDALKIEKPVNVPGFSLGGF